MEYRKEFEFEGMLDDVCNSRQILEKLLKEYELNALGDTSSEYNERREYATVVACYHKAISALRVIEVLAGV